MCWISTGVVFSLYAVLTNINEWGGEDLTYGITFTVFFFKSNVCLSQSYERSKGYKTFSGKVAFRRKLQERICKTAQNVFSSTAGYEKGVHCMWILFTKSEAFYWCR